MKKLIQISLPFAGVVLVMSSAARATECSIEEPLDGQTVIRGTADEAATSGRSL